MTEMPFARYWRRRPAGGDGAAPAPWWLRARGWWNDRSLHEQALLGALAAVACFTLLLAVIARLQTIRAAAYDQLHDAAIVEAQLRQGSGQPGAHTATRRGTPSAILTDSVAAARLVLARIEPEGGNTRIELGDAPFSQVVAWLADVERTSRLRVQQAQIDQKSPGVVSASFVFAG